MTQYNRNCKIRKPNTVEHTIFIPQSNRNTDDVIEELKEHFDQVTVRPENCPNQLDHYCSKGTEITAIRMKPTEEQIFADMGIILKIARPSRRNEDRPVLRSVRDDVTYCSVP